MNSYHYTECGLQNVIIQNLKVVIDDEGDQVITIPAVNVLHKIIATGIVSHKLGMSADELRFLRSEMGYSQAQLAQLVHHDRQSIGRWERGEFAIDGAAEAIIRKLAIEKLDLDVASGIDELSLFSMPSVKVQNIDIEACNDNGVITDYRLIAA